MKVTPDDYGRRCHFDHFCKLVLYHEAVDYFRERKRQRGWETSFETLPLSELDTLCTIDQYPSDSFIFPAYGCELQISDGLVAAAFASLPQPGQSIFMINEADCGEKSASSMTQGAARISAACSPLALLNRLPIAPECMVSMRSVNAAVRFCRTSGPYLAWAAM